MSGNKTPPSNWSKWRLYSHSKTSKSSLEKVGRINWSKLLSKCFWQDKSWGLRRCFRKEALIRRQGGIGCQNVGNPRGSHRCILRPGGWRRRGKSLIRVRILSGSLMRLKSIKLRITLVCFLDKESWKRGWKSICLLLKLSSRHSIGQGRHRTKILMIRRAFSKQRVRMFWGVFRDSLRWPQVQSRP